jgi:hypothetical protein
MSSRTLLLAVGLLAWIAGCEVATPDGVSIAHASSEARVREILGDPDFVTADEHSWKGDWSVQRYYYLDHGYVVYFHDHRVRSTALLDPAERLALYMQHRASRDLFGRIAFESSSSKVVEQLGQPQVVVSLKGEPGRWIANREAPSKFPELSLPQSHLVCFFPAHGLVVFVEEGLVTAVRPLTDYDRVEWLRNPADRTPSERDQ